MEHPPLAQHRFNDNQQLPMEQLRRRNKPHPGLHIIHPHDNHTMENTTKNKPKNPNNNQKQKPNKLTKTKKNKTKKNLINSPLNIKNLTLLLQKIRTIIKPTHMQTPSQVPTIQTNLNSFTFQLFI
jgi:hypothetical protein